MAKRKPVTFAPKTGEMYAAMEAALLEQSNQFTPGAIVKGTIRGVTGNQVFIDIGYKSEGVVQTSQFEDIAKINVGDQIDVLLEQLEGEDGMVMLSKSKADEKLYDTRLHQIRWRLDMLKEGQMSGHMSWANPWFVKNWLGKIILAHEAGIQPKLD